MIGGGHLGRGLVCHCVGCFGEIAKWAGETPAPQFRLERDDARQSLEATGIRAGLAPFVAEMEWAMCGICGLAGGRTHREYLEAMCDQMIHRGPDARGVYCSAERDVGLGHQRLSIIDLAGGAQPMSNAAGDVVITYNGETYNFLHLRRELEQKGRTFRTRSDTEVVLQAYEEWGDEAVFHLNGIFAFAVWDGPRRRLFLARDHVGVKPLFYAEREGVFAFASEVKSLLVLPWIRREIDPVALRHYLRLRYVPQPYTMWRDVRKLPQGHLLVYEKGHGRIERYYETPCGGGQRRASEPQAEEAFASLLEEIVGMQMVADVPVGAFLSGGVDSGSVVSLMARHSAKPVRTFSIGFGTERDETDAAAALAQHIGALHTSIRMKARDMRLLPETVRLMDEPLGDAIILPIFLLSQAAAREVKVVLTGEGADEILGGYVHQKNLLRLLRVSGLAGPAARVLGRAASLGARVTPVALLDLLFDYPDSLGAAGRRRLSTLLGALGRTDEMYLQHVSLFDTEDQRRILSPDWQADGQEPRHITDSLQQRLGVPSDCAPQAIFDALLEQEFRFWLPDNILLKMDKMTMGASIEGRVPFLDPRLVRYACSLPLRWKLRRTNKWILRECARRWIPGYSGHGSKQAFHVPLTGAYAEEFRALAEEWIGESRLRERGWFNVDRVLDLKKLVSVPDMLTSKKIMSIIILEMWWEQMSQVPTAAGRN